MRGNGDVCAAFVEVGNYSDAVEALIGDQSAEKGDRRSAAARCRYRSDDRAATHGQPPKQNGDRRSDRIEARDPDRLMFVDEAVASTKMARLYGRSLRGERCIAGIPHRHWKTTTFVAGLRLSGMTAPMKLDALMNGPAFLDPSQR